MQILSANFKEIMIRLYIFLSLFIYSIHLNTGTHILLFNGEHAECKITYRLSPLRKIPLKILMDLLVPQVKSGVRVVAASPAV